MTEQYYTVVADRDKGDDPTVDQISVGDRYTMQAEAGPVFTDQIVRIERPVPSSAHECRNCMGVDPDSCLFNVGRPVPTTDEPTRVQIAETIEVIHDECGDDYDAMADAVLALIQNGADRD